MSLVVTVAVFNSVSYLLVVPALLTSRLGPPHQSTKYTYSHQPPNRPPHLPTPYLTQITQFPASFGIDPKDWLGVEGVDNRIKGSNSDPD